jgi:hypothetical protein
MNLESEALTAFSRMGLPVERLGPPLENSAARWQPVLVDIVAALMVMAEDEPLCWEILSDRGRLHHLTPESIARSYELPPLYTADPDAARPGAHI